MVVPGPTLRHPGFPSLPAGLPQAGQADNGPSVSGGQPITSSGRLDPIRLRTPQSAYPRYGARVPVADRCMMVKVARDWDAVDPPPRGSRALTVGAYLFRASVCLALRSPPPCIVSISTTPGPASSTDFIATYGAWCWWAAIGAGGRYWLLVGLRRMFGLGRRCRQEWLWAAPLGCALGKRGRSGPPCASLVCRSSGLLAAERIRLHRLPP